MEIFMCLCGAEGVQDGSNIYWAPGVIKKRCAKCEKESRERVEASLRRWIEASREVGLSVDDVIKGEQEDYQVGLGPLALAEMESEYNDIHRKDEKRSEYAI